MNISELIWKLQQISFKNGEDCEVCINGLPIECITYQDELYLYNLETSNHK